MRAPSLFDAAPSPAPAAPEPRRIAFTGRRVLDGDRVAAFVHPCGICGAATAPFGSGVHLRAALTTGNARLAGTWLCRACRDGVAA